jgi:hypothetical protein
LYKCLEAILRASLDHNSLSIEKFSRWLRAICTISLARNTPADKVKAIGYVEQALSVIEDHADNNEVRSHSHPKLFNDLIVCLIDNCTLLRTTTALPHGRTAMATSNSIQHWNRVSTVRSFTLLTITLVLVTYISRSFDFFSFCYQVRQC